VILRYEANVTDKHPFISSQQLSPMLPLINLEAQMPLNICLREEAIITGIRNCDVSMQRYGMGHLNQTGEDRGELLSSEEQPPAALDEDVAKCFLSALRVGINEPTFSPQDEIQEQAALMEEQRTSVLIDLLGDKICTASHVYVYFLSLCHLYPLPFT
jgi:hypothetical protein